MIPKEYILAFSLNLVKKLAVFFALSYCFIEKRHRKKYIHTIGARFYLILPIIYPYVRYLRCPWSALWASSSGFLKHLLQDEIVHFETNEFRLKNSSIWNASFLKECSFFVKISEFIAGIFSLFIKKLFFNAVSNVFAGFFFRRTNLLVKNHISNSMILQE